jgi:hypothetical protein
MAVFFDGVFCPSTNKTVSEEVAMSKPSWLAVTWLWLVFPLAFVIPGCVQQPNGGKPDALNPDELSPKESAVAEKPSLKASEDDCVGPLTKSSSPKQLSFGDHQYLLDGYFLAQTDKAPNAEVIVGILSDSKEDTPNNRKNIGRILDFFEREKVGVIVHLGDIAGVMQAMDNIDVPEKDSTGKPLTEEEKNQYQRKAVIKAHREEMENSYKGIVELISLLAESNLPVFVISGNRECKSTFNNAMTTVMRDFPNVFNMNLIRRVDLNGLSIISMPGYHDPEYIHCPWDRCLYYESDTLNLITLAHGINQPAMLISHGPPRQKDRNGIDAVSEGVNVGNPMLTAALEKSGILFGAFGNIQEAGGKATNLDGTTIIAQNTFANSLFINPGPADSQIWSMNDGTENHGMAAVVHFVGSKAKYKTYRVGEEEKQPQP